MISDRRVTSEIDFKDLFSITDVKILENLLLELRILVKELSRLSYFKAVLAYFVSKELTSIRDYFNYLCF